MVEVHLLMFLLHACLCFLENLDQGKETDKHRQQLETHAKVDSKEIGDHAHLVVVGELADQGDKDTQKSCKNPLDHRTLAQGGNNGKSEQDDQELLNSREVDRNPRKRRGEEPQTHKADKSTDEAGGNADSQRPQSLAAFCHRESVKAGTDG